MQNHDSSALNNPVTVTSDLKMNARGGLAMDYLRTWVKTTQSAFLLSARTHRQTMDATDYYTAGVGNNSAHSYSAK